MPEQHIKQRAATATLNTFVVSKAVPYPARPEGTTACACCRISDPCPEPDCVQYSSLISKFKILWIPGSFRNPHNAARECVSCFADSECTRELTQSLRIIDEPPPISYGWWFCPL